MYVYDKANELAKSLADSVEFKALKESKTKIDANPSAKQMVDDFKKKQFELQTAQFAGQKLDDVKVSQIQSLYQVIILNPDIAEYLNAELRFSQILSDVYKIIGQAIELDMNMDLYN